MTDAKAQPCFLAIIFIGAGSSWAMDADKAAAVQQAKKALKRDWKDIYKLPKGKEIKVNLFDVTEATDGWYADFRGVFNQKTKTELPYLETVESKL